MKWDDVKINSFYYNPGFLKMAESYKVIYKSDRISCYIYFNNYFTSHRRVFTTNTWANEIETNIDHIQKVINKRSLK